jgi:hypothetical protein
MNKAQKKQVEMIKVYLSNNMTDTAARSISSLIRSAMTNKSKQELLYLAAEYNLVDNSEFII